MKTRINRPVVRASVLAVQGALGAFAMISAAQAADTSDEIKALTYPSSQIEAGAFQTNGARAKFGEFTGVTRDKLYPNGSFDIQTGSYGPDSTSAFRTRIIGNDLGLESRSLSLELGEQGTYRFNLGYDRIPRNFSDTYQTIYNGVGTQTLTLPPALFGANHAAPLATPTNGTVSAANLNIRQTANALANWNNIQAPNASPGTTASPILTNTQNGPGYLIPAAMHNFDIGTTRTRTDLGYSRYLTDNIEFKASFRNEDKEGTKLTGSAMGGFRGALLPEPIDNTHQQFDASVRWFNKTAQLQLGYYGSFFKNNIGLWSAQNPFAAGAVTGDVATMTSPPGNEFNQLNMSGMYKFSPSTQASFAASYGRRTQDASFQYNPAQFGNTRAFTFAAQDLGRHSLDGLVITKTLDLKLTSRPMRDLSLVATYKYDDKDNRTQPLTSFANGSPELATNTLVSAANQHESHAPSKQVQRATVDVDYRITAAQAVKVGYEYEQIKRSCSSNISSECIFEVDKTYENTLRGEYRSTFADSLNGRVSYAHSERRANDYEDDPSQIPGTRRAFIAPYNRDKVRSALNFQPNERWAMTGGVDYNRTNYLESVFGMTESKSWVFNLDSSFNVSENLGFTAYYSYEDISNTVKANARGSANGSGVPVGGVGTCTDILGAGGVAAQSEANAINNPCRNWEMNQKDKVHTVGLSLKQKGLMGGKLQLTGDVAYSKATTPIDVNGHGYFSDGINQRYLAAEDFPNIKTEYFDFRLTGLYAIDKAQAVHVSYLYRHLKTADWQWDAYANSSLGVVATQAYIGPGITSPDYNVHAVGVSYVYTFR